jgi:CP family cyanate transporter-like MFS transporter
VPERDSRRSPQRTALGVQREALRHAVSTASSDAARVEPSSPPRNVWLILALAWLSYAYFGAMASSLAPILPAVERDLHLTSVQGGLLLGTYPLMYVAASLAVGALADRFGVRRAVTTGLVLITASALLRSATSNFIEMLAATSLIGLGGPVVSTVLPKLVAEGFTGKARVRAAGIYVTGPAVGGALTFAFTNSVAIPAVGGWRHLYLVYAVGGTLVTALWLRGAPRTAEHLGLDPHGRGSMRRVLRSPAVWRIVVVGIVVFTVGQGLTSWLPSILTTHGIALSQAGVLVSVSRILQVPGNLLITGLLARSERTSATSMAVVGMLVTIGISVSLILFGNPVWIAIALFAQGLAVGGLLPALISALMNVHGIRAGDVATAAGLFFTIGQSAGAGAPVVVGWLRDTTGNFDAGLIFVIAVVLAAALPGALIRDLRPVQATTRDGG